jgi:hypothetical protein
MIALMRGNSLDSHPHSLQETRIVNVQLTQLGDNLSTWKVKSIVKLPNDGGIEVTFNGENGPPVRFLAADFGVGERGAKSAALARFAAAAGFGDSEDIFEFLTDFPQESPGILFSEGEEFDLGHFTDEF